VQYFFFIWLVKYRFHLVGQLTSGDGGGDGDDGDNGGVAGGDIVTSPSECCRES